MQTPPLLEVQNLKVSFHVEKSTYPVLRGISYALPAGKVLAVVGESGCGKTVHALSLLRLLPPTARITEGAIRYRGKDVLTLPTEELRRLRGEKISMIFQDPSAGLNPVLTVGEQLIETLLAHRRLSRGQARETAVQLLKKVGITQAENRLKEYPFQFSGGMCQRVMIAMALALGPDVLIADEPTTALDVTIQAQILRLIKDLQQESKMAVVFITHNLALASELADEVMVLYAGLCMEQASAADLFARPLHPYTRGLLDTLVSLKKRPEVLPAIPGNPPVAGEEIIGCPFAPRCSHATDKCRKEVPPLFEKGTRRVRCWLEEEK